MPDFIGRYECPIELCDELVKFYHDNKELHRKGETNKGAISNVVNSEAKDSIELGINVQEVANNPIFQKYHKHLSECINKYADKYEGLKYTHPFDLIESYNIQHYPIGGGFKNWHCERGGTLDYTIKKVLVFMTYLNDLDDGGTMFKHYDLTEKAVKGKTLLFSADWFHLHKGQISQTKEKTIVTGWLSHKWDF
tara:strand:- start:177 stop:758 length:582 start_codon:yes stop_codon:yes gene_type:complete